MRPETMGGRVDLVALLGAAPATAQPAGANYDEAKVPAYTLPDPLRFAGRPSRRDAADWPERRAEVLRLFEEHVYGRSPAAPPGMRSVVVESDPRALGGLATRRQVRVLLDGTDSGPAFEILLYVPNAAPRPVPAFLGLNFDGNHAVHPDPGIRLSTAWMDDGPGRRGEPRDRGRAGDERGGLAGRAHSRPRLRARDRLLRRPRARPPGRLEEAACGPGSARARAGRFGPDDWGAIGAWAWGLSRALDVWRRTPTWTARRVAVIGHSRLGKTALWAGAHGRAIRARRLERLGRGRGRARPPAVRRDDRPHHERLPALVRAAPAGVRRARGRAAGGPAQLLALVAPRPLYVASATEDLWADPRGEFLAAKAAEPVYRLLGRDGLGVADLPSPDRPVGGSIGYHLRTGKHALTAYDWEQYLDFADRHLPGAKTSR